MKPTTFKRTLFMTLICVNLGCSSEIFDILIKLDKVVDFGLRFYPDLNLDAVLGYTIAQAQLEEALLHLIDNKNVKFEIGSLITKISKIRALFEYNFKKSKKSKIFEHYLLKPQNWIIGNDPFQPPLKNLGVYTNWTENYILEDRTAIYKNIKSDFCLVEILENDCKISDFCNEMMFSPRIDHGYLLSHRLLYLQVIRIKGCRINRRKIRSLTYNFCSLMLKEAKTNELLGFPAHDIFLEQVLLCGVQGFVEEFLQENWRDLVNSWQTPYGCYTDSSPNNYNNDQIEVTKKRSSNLIISGCTDHATGLGAAVLALELKYLI